MRKLLLGTTAVVGAALLAPEMAAAQQAPTVRLGGYFRAYYGYTQQTSPHVTGVTPQGTVVQASTRWRRRRRHRRHCHRAGRRHQRHHGQHDAIRAHRQARLLDRRRDPRLRQRQDRQRPDLRRRGRDPVRRERGHRAHVPADLHLQDRRRHRRGVRLHRLAHPRPGALRRRGRPLRRPDERRLHHQLRLRRRVRRLGETSSSARTAPPPRRARWATTPRSSICRRSSSASTSAPPGRSTRAKASDTGCTSSFAGAQLRPRLRGNRRDRVRPRQPQPAGPPQRVPGHGALARQCRPGRPRGRRRRDAAPRRCATSP